MKLSGLYLLAGFSLFVGGCETADDAGGAADTAPGDTMGAMMEDTATAPMDTGVAAGMPMTEETLELGPVDDSGVSGDATLAGMDGQTEIRVTIMGTAGNTTHQGHIHTGTCDSLGEVVVALEEITTSSDGSGTSTTTVDIPLDSIAGGSHLIAYHSAGGSPGPHITCAEFPAQGM